MAASLRKKERYFSKNRKDSDNQINAIHFGFEKYCNSLTSYSRYKTREVNIGGVALGGNNPIRVQSMTTTDTMDTLATVEQSIRIIEAGSDYVRITAPSINEARNLLNIQNELRNRGYSTPLIADIHFTPNAAELAATIVAKVRVNPGNYADKKKFNIIEYTDTDYESELDRIRQKFTPLVRICKEHGTAMRIGTNHGSLSDRIMSRFGDTPLGMVESALEFLRICEDNDYHEIVLSMKASNPKVMIQAYRLLITKMHEEGMNYPLHIGVTEAGDGEDGRIKSSVGIGSLLEDGIGDTVRVSLTEDPEFEIPVALKLIERYSSRIPHDAIPSINEIPIDPFEYNKRSTIAVGKTGGNNVPVVVVNANEKIFAGHEGLRDYGYIYSESLDKWTIGDMAPDYLYLGSKDLDYNLPGTLKKIFDYNYWLDHGSKHESIPLLTVEEILAAAELSEKENFIKIDAGELSDDLLSAIYDKKNIMLLLSSGNKHRMAALRRAISELVIRNCNVPVVLDLEFDNCDDETLTLQASTDAGALLSDGFGDGIRITAENSPAKINSISFGILQATRTRISKTEYISCPSCGRTLFDLQETTAMIRSRTNHLKGVKIAIMGCIVNGPGEMADADYGYVGSGPGKITLYKGKEVVKKSVDTEVAVDELIELIRENGDWIELQSNN
ncbi:MAG: (E)-4-hydroxy-3-methylbut-2-enyl-diphosphate synthase [Ignavibacteria bacterium]|nr:(E)-4-hydroxy-3-methylbut-2-enyl-diphosphate synthase [Ignavibacteria bacterium]